MGVGIILAAIAVSGVCGLIDSDTLMLRDNDVRLGDVVQGDCFDAANSGLGAAVIASLPTNRSEMQLTRAALANLVRRRAPGLVINASQANSRVVLRTQASPQRATDQRRCYAAALAIPAGEPINRANLLLTDCTGRDNAPVAYDRIYAVVRAGIDIPAGAYVGQLSIPQRAINTGDALAMVATEGAVRVERAVTAAQPASRGGALFVRDEEGHISSAPLEQPNQEVGAP